MVPELAARSHIEKIDLIVKKAIDEFVKVNNFKCEIMLNHRFAKIEKKIYL